MFKGFNQRGFSFSSIPTNTVSSLNSAYNVSGCTFWLDASYGLNTQTNLAAVTSWVDKISNTRFYQNTASYQPRYITSDSNFNNLPTVDFSVDSNRFLASDVFANVGNCIVFVARYSVLQGTNELLTLGGSDSFFYSSYLLAGNGSSSYTGIGQRNASTGIVVCGTTENTNTKIGIIQKNKIYVNNTEEWSGTIADMFNIKNIGGRAGANVYGQIAEVLFFNKLLTVQEVDIISTGLNQKYAIY